MSAQWRKMFIISQAAYMQKFGNFWSTVRPFFNFHVEPVLDKLEKKTKPRGPRSSASQTGRCSDRADHSRPSPPISLPCRPPSTASTSYNGSPTPVKDPFSLLRPPTPLHLCAADVEPRCNTILAPLNSQLTRPRAPVQHRAAPRPSRMPPRPPVRASIIGSSSATSTVVDSFGEPPSDLFFASK
jgi:hypothetical protein